MPQHQIRPSADTAVLQEHSGRLDGVYSALKARILAGDYLPNQRLIEVDLTKSFGASRATVRSALARLKGDGIVDIEAKRGARVRSVKLEDALRILEIREVLEGFAASLAATKGTLAQFKAIEKILVGMEKTWAVDDFGGHTRLNGCFHEAIMTAAAHDALKHTLDSLQFSLVRFRFRFALIPGRRMKSIAEHRRIYECLVKRDAPAAERAMRKHIAQVREDLATAKNIMSI